MVDPFGELNLPGYLILATLRFGRRSRVYRGVREADARPVILKAPAITTSALRDLRSLQREHALLVDLDLPGVIRSYGLESAEHLPVLVLEDFGGQALAQLPKPLEIGFFLELAIEIAGTLAEIHSCNVIHKDINPTNILYSAETDEVKLIDFEISTRLSREVLSIKHPSQLEGTLAYMSPEQTGRMNRSLDYRSDFYSLGASFYELLTGHLPYPTQDLLELVHCHLARKPLPPRQWRPEIPAALAAIVLKLMAKNAEDRYQSAWGLQADLRRVQQGLASRRAAAPDGALDLDQVAGWGRRLSWSRRLNWGSRTGAIASPFAASSMDAIAKSPNC